MKAIGYVRVSTGRQVDNGISMDAQEARIRQWASLFECDLLAVYRDAGITGTRADIRDGFLRALEHACKEGAALVVYSLSRFARNTREAIEYSDRLGRCGGDLISLSEQIDTTSAAGKMVFRMFAVLAEFESDLASERTKAAAAHAKASGRRFGGVPYGKALLENGKTLADDSEERVVIETMRSLRARGYSYRRICLELERLGIKTKTGREKWNPKVVRGIIKEGE